MAVPFKSTVFTGGSFSASGSNGHASAGLLIYSASKTDSGLMPAADLAAVGKDVFLYISGVAGSRGTSTPGSIVIGGDLIISGNAYGSNGLPIGGNQPTFLYSTTAGSVYTTGSFAFVGNEAGVDAPSDKGSDVNFYVKGTAGSRGTGTAGTALFSGDLYVSGTVYSNEFKTTIISSSIIYSSGSTLFGNSADDTHTFIGSITGSSGFFLSGSLNVRSDATIAGTVTMPGTVYFTGEGGQNIVHNAGSGNLSITSTNGNVYIEGTRFIGNDVAIMGDLQVNGGDLTSPATTMNIFNSVSYINFGVGVPDIRMGTTAGAVTMYGQLAVSGTTYLGDSTSDTTYVSGLLRAPYLSGSLTRLTSGLSYLEAGSNITITSQSNGQVTISSTGGSGGSSYFGSSLAGYIYATGSLALVGSEGITAATSKGSDVFIYASGTVGGRGSASGKISLFGGDTATSGSSYVSGSLYVGLGASRGALSYDGLSNVFTVASAGGKVLVDSTNYEVASSNVLYSGATSWQAYTTNFDLYNYDTNQKMLSVTEPNDVGDVIFEIGRPEFEVAELRVNGQIFASGSITSLLPYNYIKSEGGFTGSLTRLTDGRSFLAAGSNVTITSQSNGQITISSTGGGGSPGGSDTFIQFNDGGAFNGTGGLTFNKTTSSLTVTGSIFASSSAGVIVQDGAQPTVTVRASSDTTNQGVFYQEIGGDTYISNQKNSGKFFSSVKTSAGVAVRYLRAIPNSVNYNTIVSFVQGLHDFFDPQTNTSDVNFYVGGKVGSKGTTGQRGTALFAGDVVVSGSTHMQNGGSITGSVSIQGSIIPSADSTYTLGTDTQRWGHVYTGDLHLRNERGDWTILEEPDFLCVINNKTGKKYKMMLQPLE